MVARERFSNAAATTLDGAINASVTSITVVDGSVFPSEGNFRVAIESEIVNVTARSGNSLTVTRGSDNSTAASHDSGATATLIITEGNLREFFREAGNVQHVTAGFTDWNQRHRLLDSSGVTLTNASFSSTTDADANDAWGGYTVTQNAVGIIDVGLETRTAPSTPYTVTARMSMSNPTKNGSSGNFMGLGFRQTATSEIMGVMFRPDEDVSVFKFDDTSTVNTGEIGTVAFFYRNDLWLQIENDGTDLYFRASWDGVTFRQIATEAVGTFLTPNQVCWWVDNRNKSGHKFSLLSWLEE